MTPATFAERIDEYELKWRAADEALYSLCREHPHHSSIDGVNAKLMLIGRAYATGIERIVGGQISTGEVLDRIGEFFVENGGQVDALIDELRRFSDLDTESVPAILRVHGALVELLRRLTRDGMSARSFVSKYLHFHCPVVVIFDSIAQASMQRLVPKRQAMTIVPCTDSYDPDYYDYVMRFWRLFGKLRGSEVGDRVTVKRLDYCVWAKPGQ